MKPCDRGLCSALLHFFRKGTDMKKSTKPVLAKSALAKLDTLCEAAMAHGWESFQGNSGRVGKTTQVYDAARSKIYDLLLQQQQRLKSLQTQSKQQPIIYAPGTKVVYQGKVPGRGISNNFGGRATIICEVSLTTGEIEYGTLEGAWFSHEDFIWVADPTPESLSDAINYASKDEPEDEEDDEEEDVSQKSGNKYTLR
jgi:hypothetical protein